MGTVECYRNMEIRQGRKRKDVSRVSRPVHAILPTSGEIKRQTISEISGVAMDEQKNGSDGIGNRTVNYLSVDREGLGGVIRSAARSGRSAGRDTTVAVTLLVATLVGIVALLIGQSFMRAEVAEANLKLEQAEQHLKQVEVVIVNDMQKRFDQEILHMKQDPSYFEQRVASAEKRTQ